MNPPPSDTSLWEQAAAAARRARPAAGLPAAVEGPPPGFAARLANRWAELRQNETFLRWCRWSFRAALVALAAAALAWALAPAPTPPLSPPQVEVPTLSAP